jgi:outer membrane murein-binding lipoprotein Lpp
MPEPQKDNWLKLAALTVIVLTLAAGISAFKSINYATRVQIYAAREARQWQDYQVESIKKDNYGLNRDILASLKLPEGKTSKTPKNLASKIKEYEDEMSRLNQEKDQIKKVAQTLGAQGDALAQKAGELSLAVILFQLGIMSTATAVLTRKKILWLVGLALGVWGLVHLGIALLL